MDSSQFTDNQSRYEAIEQMETQGATCDTFRVKLYGKLHFLKRLKVEHVGDIRYQEALRKEFETGYRLEHPNLVRYLSLDNNSILMEYVDGETLSQRLASHPDYFKNRKNTDKFVRQLLDVLGYLHSHQVLHLDLKPDNILLTHINDDVKLIDLGCCYTDTFTDTTGWTESYAAPEQLAGNKTDVRTDIYALGKILELLPSHHIYNKVIARCTAENPSDRYQSITEVARTIASSTRSRHILYALIALLFVVAVVVFILLSQGKEPQQEQRVAPVDTLSVKSVDTTSVTPVSVLPREEDKQQKKVQTTSSIPEPVTPAPSPSKKTSIEQLRADISKAVLPKFNATLGALSDSVQPGTTAWTEAGWALEASLENTLKDLILSHSDIPMEQVAKEYTSYLQSLITLKYNKAMKRQTE